MIRFGSCGDFVTDVLVIPGLVLKGATRMTGFCPLASLSWPQVLATASRNGASKLHAKPMRQTRRTSLSREFPQICSFRRRSTRTKRLSPGSNHTVPSDPHKPYFQHVTAALQAGKAKLTITWDLGCRTRTI